MLSNTDVSIENRFGGRFIVTAFAGINGGVGWSQYPVLRVTMMFVMKLEMRGERVAFIAMKLGFPVSVFHVGF